MPNTVMSALAVQAFHGMRPALMEAMKDKGCPDWRENGCACTAAQADEWIAKMSMDEVSAAVFLDDLAVKTGATIGALRDAGFPERIPTYLARGTSVEAVAGAYARRHAKAMPVYRSHALSTFGHLISLYFDGSEMVELKDRSRWVFGQTSHNFLCVQTPGGGEVGVGHPFYNKENPHPGRRPLAPHIVTCGRQVGVRSYKATEYQGEVIKLAVSSFGHLIKSVALRRMSFREFADVIRKHYDPDTPRIRETLDVLDAVDALNPT